MGGEGGGGEDCGYFVFWSLRPKLLALCCLFFFSEYLIYHTLLIIGELYNKLMVICSSSRS